MARARIWIVVGAALVGTAVAAAPATAAVVDVPCARGLEATSQVNASRDAVLGPLVLIGGLRHGGHAPNGYNRKGYKIPVTVPEGVRATLTVPASMRGRVGLVYTPRANDRVWEEGVRAAASSVRFTACAPGRVPGHTGWPGGLVVDRPRCVTLVVKVAGQPAVEQRLPLGRRC